MTLIDNCCNLLCLNTESIKVEDKDLSEIREYITDLKTIKSEVIQILGEDHERTISKAAEHYTVKLNQLLTQRNIKSANVIFPVFELTFINKREQDVDLINLNLAKDDIELLWDVVRRIDQELENLTRT